MLLQVEHGWTSPWKTCLKILVLPQISSFRALKVYKKLRSLSKVINLALLSLHLPHIGENTFLSTLQEFSGHNLAQYN